MKRLILGLVVIVLFSLTACTEEPEVFQITYALNGGVFTDQANTISEIESGSSMSEPVVSKEDYVFKGWYTDSTYNIPYDFSQPIIGDLQLHAKWDYDAILVEQFNIIAELLETVGSSLSKEGYSFDGWFLDDELTNELNLTEILGEADPVIFAKWVLNEYTVTFYALDEIAYQETYLFGQTITVPSEYSITDYTFEGVYLEDSYTTDVNTGITMPAADLDLYIKMDSINTYYNIVFSPSRDAAAILTATTTLPNLLTAELELLGYQNVFFNISVGDTYEAAGNALRIGDADIGFLFSGTYVLTKDVVDSPIDVILAATRGSLNKDFSDAKDWNDGLATEADPLSFVPYYKGLIIAGPSAAGQAVAAKVNNGEDLVWADVSGLTWCIRSATSASGYLYPNIYLMSMFDKTFNDFPSAQVIQTDGYGTSMGNLASGTCDVATFYADARRDYATKWEDSAEGFSRSASIWTETNVIAVTANIMSDTIAVNTTTIHANVIAAITQAFINIAKTTEGQEIIAIYSHQGYVEIDDEDYDNERIVQALLGN